MAVSERTANNQPVTVPREITPDTAVPQETVRIVTGNQVAPETPAVTNDNQHLQATAEPVSDILSVRVKPVVIATEEVPAVTNEAAPEHVAADTVNDAAVTEEPAFPSTEQRIVPEQTVIAGEHTIPEETAPISLRSRAITPVQKDGAIAVISTETSPVETGNIIDTDIPAVQNNDGSRDAKDVATRPAAHHYISGAPETDQPAVTRQTTDARPQFINHHDSPTRRVQHMSGASGGQENNLQPSQQQSVAPDQAMNGPMTGSQGFESLIAAAASTDGRNVVLQDTSDASSSLDGIDPLPGTGGASSEAVTSKVKTADKSGEARFANLSAERQEQVFSTIVRYARIMVHEGKSTATIRLEPPSLGRVRLEISTENARVTGKIVVEKAEVRDIVKHHLPELRESLAQNGLKVESFDVQVGHNGGTDNWAHRQMMENQRGQGIREPLSKNAPLASGTAEIIRSQPNRLIRNGIVDIRI